MGIVRNWKRWLADSGGDEIGVVGNPQVVSGDLTNSGVTGVFRSATSSVVDESNFSTIAIPAGLMPRPVAAGAACAVLGAAADTSKDITVYGLDGSGAPVSETITTNAGDGSIPVDGVQLFSRIDYAVAHTDVIGTGPIVVVDAATHAIIWAIGIAATANVGAQSTLGCAAAYTIPTGYTGYLNGWGAKTQGHTSPVLVGAFIRPFPYATNKFHTIDRMRLEPTVSTNGSTHMSETRRLGVGGAATSGYPLPARTDIELRGLRLSGVGNVDVDAWMALTLVAN